MLSFFLYSLSFFFFQTTWFFRSSLSSFFFSLRCTAFAFPPTRCTRTRTHSRRAGGRGRFPYYLYVDSSRGRPRDFYQFVYVRVALVTRSSRISGVQLLSTFRRTHVMPCVLHYDCTRLDSLYSVSNGHPASVENGRILPTPTDQEYRNIRYGACDFMSFKNAHRF